MNTHRNFGLESLRSIDRIRERSMGIKSDVRTCKRCKDRVFIDDTVIIPEKNGSHYRLCRKCSTKHFNRGIRALDSWW